MLLLISFIFTLPACTTSSYRGDGTVISVKKIKEKDYMPHDATKKGAAVGYTVDTTRPDAAEYQFVVKPDDGSKALTIKQYSSPIQAQSTVHILANDNGYFIRQ